jgi:hypothetical protein
MNELYRETKKLLVENEIYFRGDLATGYVGWWWALWLVNSMVGVFVFRYSMNATTIDDFVTATQVSLAAKIVGIPLAILAIKVVKDYSAVEPLLQDIKGDGDATPITISV